MTFRKLKRFRLRLNTIFRPFYSLQPCKMLERLRNPKNNKKKVKRNRNGWLHELRKCNLTILIRKEKLR